MVQYARHSLKNVDYTRILRAVKYANSQLVNLGVEANKL